MSRYKNWRRLGSLALSRATRALLLEKNDPGDAPRSFKGFDPAAFVGTRAVATFGLKPGTYTALVVDGVVYVARLHWVAWRLAGSKGVEEFYNFTEIDEAGKVVRLIR